MPVTSRWYLPRLLAPFAVTMVLIVGACGAVVYLAGQRAARDGQYRDLNELTTLVRRWLHSGDAPTPDDRQRLSEAASVLGTRITLIGGDGSVLFDSHADVASMSNHNDRPEVIQARASGTGRSVRQSETMHERSIYVAEPLDPVNRGGTIVRLSYPQSYWMQLDVPVWTILMAGMASALLLTALLTLLLQRQWVGPVRALASATERMAGGDWRVRVPPRGADDVKFFSAKLNILANNAERQVTQLHHQRGDLQALVDTLPDPFLVTDAHQRVLLINAPAARLLNMTPGQVLGQKLVNVVTDEPVLALFEEGLAGRVGERADEAAPNSNDVPISFQREIRLHRDGQRLMYQAMVTRTAAGGVLLVLRDVSTLSNAMQMKADFVANASHELRTPIAAIKVAFETLRDVYTEDPPQTERCIQIIEEHLRRLEEMLRDLLDLSRVESPDLKPHLGTVNAGELFSLLRSTMGPLARQKGVELRLADGSEGVTFVSDERLLNLVLKNLAENSIKFTPAGGRVVVSAAQAPLSSIAGVSLEETTATEAIVLRVSDTGIGIPQEHIDRVFERFYQVNASRTGSAGRGTGLGLAIVKHAVAALGGAVRLESSVGQGTTVTCVLPQHETAMEAGSAT